MRGEKGVQFSARIDPKLKKEFYDMVYAKYGTLYATVKIELEDALKHYIELKHTTLHAKNDNAPRAVRKCEEIMAVIRPQADTVNKWDLAKIITGLIGSDPRTIKHWTENLLTLGYLRQENPNFYFVVKEKNLVVEAIQ